MTSLIRKLENLSSPAFAEVSEPGIRTGKRFARDTSSESHSFGIRRIDTPTKDRLKPSDHSASDLFGASATPDPVLSRADLTPEKKAPVQPRLKQKNPAKPYPRPQDMLIKTVKISGLKEKDDQTSIKNLCSGLHIINIKPDIDNVTGHCNGMAEVRLRLFDSKDLDKLRLNLLEKGLKADEVNEKKGLKKVFSTNTHFLNPNLQSEERRLAGNDLKSDERKQANLASSDLFRKTETWAMKERNLDDVRELKETIANLQQWDRMQRKFSKQYISPIKTNAAGYLRATVSSLNKGKASSN